jgi:hypothetical protein
MKMVLRYLMYSIAIVLLVVGCTSIFKYHPEVQFAFIMPGLFILLFSIIRDDIYKRNSLSLLRAGFRGK